MKIKRFYQINEDTEPYEYPKEVKKIFRKFIIRFVEDNINLDDYNTESDDDFVSFVLYDVTDSDFNIKEYNGVKYAVMGMESFYFLTERHFFIFNPDTMKIEYPGEELLEEMMAYDDENFFMTTFTDVDTFGKDQIESIITPTDIAKKVNK